MPRRPPVVVFDTETRHLSPERAAQEVKRFIRQSGVGHPRLIKVSGGNTSVGRPARRRRSASVRPCNRTSCSYAVAAAAEKLTLSNFARSSYALRLLHSLAPHERILDRAEPRPLPGGRVSFATCTSRQAEARRVGAGSGGQRVMKPSSANPAIDPIPQHSMILAESLRHDKVWSREALQCPPVVPKLSGL